MLSIQNKQVVSSLLVVLFFSTSIAQASNLDPSQKNIGQGQKARSPITVSVTIKARPELVWLSIHEDRTEDPELVSSKVLEDDGNNSVLEQTFRYLCWATQLA